MRVPTGKSNELESIARVRHLVAVAHSCHGDDCPPEPDRDVVESGVLCVKDNAGEDEDSSKQEHDH